MSNQSLSEPSISRDELGGRTETITIGSAGDHARVLRPAKIMRVFDDDTLAVEKQSRQAKTFPVKTSHHSPLSPLRGPRSCSESRKSLQHRAFDQSADCMPGDHVDLLNDGGLVRRHGQKMPAQRPHFGLRRAGEADRH